MTMNLPANRLVLKISKARILFINILVTVSLSILIIYLFTLQIVEGIKYQKQAKEILKRDIPIIAQRGQIFDRYYDVPLVYNIDSFAVDVIPGDIPNEMKEEIFFRLAKVLQIEVSEVRKRIPLRFYNNYQPREIKSGVSYSKIAYIAEHIEEFPGVTWHNKPIRGYLFTNSLAHILGYTGDIADDELNTLYNKGYTLNSTIGKSGIEKQYDFILKGKDGKRFKIVDVKEKQLKAKADEDIPPEPGHTLVLTIDRHLQLLAQKALGERIGSAIVLKPATGEILAMVSYPWFDPGIFYSESAAEKFKDLSLDIRFPFLNRAIQAQYPPASVFKLIMSTAMIEEDAFPISEKINCTGKMELGDRVAHCWKKHGHGKLDFFKALANSCNIYYFTVGIEYIKIDTIVRYARIFGLGSETGIDLPEESPGFLPTPEWKYKKEHMKWLDGDTMNISIGQGWTTVTPLQLANVVAMIVNEGTVYKPHLLKQIRDSITGDVVREIQKEVLHEALISKKTFDLVKKAMRTVVTEGTGGRLITTRAVKVAGKTGSPETGEEGEYHSWFVSYAPHDADPEDQVVVVAIIEEVNIEKWWAQRTVNIICQGIFANQTYEEAAVTLYPWMRKSIMESSGSTE